MAGCDKKVKLLLSELFPFVSGRKVEKGHFQRFQLDFTKSSIAAKRIYIKNENCTILTR